MTERKKDLLALSALLAMLVCYFSRIIFTDQIIRAPDITSEFYWMVKHFKEISFPDLFSINLSPVWNSYINSGATDSGGSIALQLLVYRSLLFWLLPEPANIACFVVFHLFVGGAGAYLYCRLIGVSRMGGILAGLIFAIAPENASLINAGHVQKIATISFAPWAFYFIERSFRDRRIVYAMAAALVLAFQFFNMHWQVCFYTCLAIGGYAFFRTAGIIVSEREKPGFRPLNLLSINVVVLFFFLSSAAVSLLPLYEWSKESTRGVQSGANQGKGGLDVEEAMSWSMPPEELVSFVVPGMFGYSRQEGGGNSKDIVSYYWGRMNFTQTTDYLGLLPWLLLPLPLIFRRDRYTWLALAGLVLGILFSLGKYTQFYWYLFDYFPGINRFRVPKMMMFIPVLAIGVLAARGVDCLRDPELRARRGFRAWLTGVASLPVLLLGFYAVARIWDEGVFNLFMPQISQPNRYEQGVTLISQRWRNLLDETLIASGVAAAYAALLWCSRFRIRLLMPLLIALGAFYLADTFSVNSKFMLLQQMPTEGRGTRTPLIDFLSKGTGDQYRVLPVAGVDPMIFAVNKVPVLFTSNPVQLKRWQDFLDAFTLTSAMPDMMNVRYLVSDEADYLAGKAMYGDRYVPVYRAPDGTLLVLENSAVMPKAWLVPAAVQVSDSAQMLAIMQSPRFNPRTLALIESQPPIPLSSPEQISVSPGKADLVKYEGGRIAIQAEVTTNALLVLGEKYMNGWKAYDNGSSLPIHPVNYVLRGVYLKPGNHRIEFVFDPWPFRVGKWLTFGSLSLFAFVWCFEWRRMKRQSKSCPATA